MTDPYPERRRQDRLDHTDHRREVENRHRDRRGQRGPSQRRINKALNAVATHDVPGTPGVGHLKVLRELHESEWEAETRRVRDFSITRGDPEHGAYRSVDHVGRYELDVPFEEVSDDTFAGDCCPECGGEMAVYKERSHHYIAGSVSLFCARCETNIHSEDWG